MKSPITFAKIVATPTITSWAQAYNAGNLAAVISLTQKPIKNDDEKTFEDELSLQVLGKELLNTLEAEYFTLETKNLATVKQAINTTVEKAVGPVIVSLGVSVIIENVLYVFQYGAGKILMKRKEKLGTLLEQSEEEKLTAASGFIENNDIVILETPSFIDIVPTDSLLPVLEHDKLTNMAEILSPIIHEHTEGGAAAIAFSYKEETQETKDQHEELLSEDEHEGTEAVVEEQEASQEPTKIPMPIRKKRSFPTLPFSHSRRLFLTIGVILALVLIGSVFFSIKRQRETAAQKLYDATIVPAQKKYDEGQSLLSLNKNLAKDDFQTAKNILDDAKNRFSSNSTQEKQITDLLAKVNDGLSQTAQINLASAKQIDTSTDLLLQAYINHPNAKYADSDTSALYIADNTGITAIGKSSAKEKVAITNSTDWKNIGGFGTYLGNFYVLDKNDGISKYTGQSQAAKSSYFSGTSPDLSKAVDMTIDGSLWILASDGTIAKYTRGKPDDFSLKGLDKQFTNPTRIMTSVDMDHVYVLDNGNSRIVVFDKNGNYTAQYQSDIINQATAMDVSEKDKKANVLSGGKVYSIDLK